MLKELQHQHDFFFVSGKTHPRLHPLYSVPYITRPVYICIHFLYPFFFQTIYIYIAYFIVCYFSGEIVFCEFFWIPMKLLFPWKDSWQLIVQIHIVLKIHMYWNIICEMEKCREILLHGISHIILFQVVAKCAVWKILAPLTLIYADLCSFLSSFRQQRMSSVGIDVSNNLIMQVL